MQLSIYINKKQGKNGWLYEWLFFNFFLVLVGFMLFLLHDKQKVYKRNFGRKIGK